MKRFILPLFIGIGISAFGQNVTENRVTFNYIQLPTNPISDEYKTFNVMVERKFEQANEDSLVAYQTRLDAATTQYEAEMTAWKEQRRVVQRTYLQNMASWQKSVNAGTPATKPADPVFPPQPVMAEIIDPQLHSDLTDEQVSNAVSLAGFDRGEGGATITVGVLPLSDVKINMTVKGEGAQKKYNYNCNYKLPLELKVETPSQGVILQTIILNNLKTYNMKSYNSQYEYDLWWLDNQTQFWTELETYARNSAFKSLNTEVNNKCGYAVKSITAEVYTVKKFKDHQYNDLVNAYTVATQGYQAIGQSRDRSNAHGKLNEAITIWKQMLTESDVNNSKARINDKVTALLQCNIAYAYIWLSEFDQAEQYMNQAINSRVGKFKRIAQGYKGFLNERKIRWNTNY